PRRAALPAQRRRPRGGRPGAVADGALARRRGRHEPAPLGSGVPGRRLTVDALPLGPGESNHRSADSPDRRALSTVVGRCAGSGDELSTLFRPWLATREPGGNCSLTVANNLDGG